MKTLYGSKVIDVPQKYFIVEELGSVVTVKDFDKLISDIFSHTAQKDYKVRTVILNQQQNKKFSEYLVSKGFFYKETRYLYQRQIDDIQYSEFKPDIKFIPSPEVGEALFVKALEEVMEGSLNVSSTLNAAELLQGLKKELDAAYIKSCLLAYDKDELIGITMPHIEPGTKHEGRLFYIGIRPIHRKKGYGSLLHRESLRKLHSMGAKVYIGSTGEHNIPMQKLFIKNGCSLLDIHTSYELKKLEKDGKGGDK